MPFSSSYEVLVQSDVAPGFPLDEPSDRAIISAVEGGGGHLATLRIKARSKTHSVISRLAKSGKSSSGREPDRRFFHYVCPWYRQEKGSDELLCKSNCGGWLFA